VAGVISDDENSQKIRERERDKVKKRDTNKKSEKGFQIFRASN